MLSLIVGFVLYWIASAVTMYCMYRQEVATRYRYSNGYTALRKEPITPTSDQVVERALADDDFLICATFWWIYAIYYACIGFGKGLRYLLALSIYGVSWCVGSLYHYISVKEGEALARKQREREEPQEEHFTLGDDR
jgi:hypothetical protein